MCGHRRRGISNCKRERVVIFERMQSLNFWVTCPSKTSVDAAKSSIRFSMIVEQTNRSRKVRWFAHTHTHEKMPDETVSQSELPIFWQGNSDESISIKHSEHVMTEKFGESRQPQVASPFWNLGRRSERSYRWGQNSSLLSFNLSDDISLTPNDI